VRLHQLDPVAERIADVEAVEAIQRLVRDRLGTSGAQPDGQGRQVAHDEGRVRLAGRAEVALDAEMHAHAAVPVVEPDAAAAGEVGRLEDLAQTERVGVEYARLANVVRQRQ
jgi:hypothetical protein